jgi:hypothetical protein
VDDKDDQLNHEAKIARIGATEFKVKLANASQDDEGRERGEHKANSDVCLRDPLDPASRATGHPFVVTRSNFPEHRWEPRWSPVHTIGTAARQRLISRSTGRRSSSRRLRAGGRALPVARTYCPTVIGARSRCRATRLTASPDGSTPTPRPAVSGPCTTPPPRSLHHGDHRTRCCADPVNSPRLSGPPRRRVTRRAPSRARSSINWIVARACAGRSL